MGETRRALYQQWLAGRGIDFADNSRENIINMAMEESCLNGKWGLYNIVIVTDQEAVEWMFNHVPTLKSISKPDVITVLIEILHSEIVYVNKVATGEEQSDGHIRPTIDKMNDLIRTLEQASAAPASAAPASAGGSHRRRHKKSAKKSKKSKSRKSKKSKKTKSRRH